MSQDPYTPGPGENPYEPRPGGEPYSQPETNPYEARAYATPGGGPYEPRQRQLPLGEALKELPNQYIRVLTRPGAPVIAEELWKARWDVIWVQLLIMAVISAIAGYITYLISPGGMMMPGMNPGVAGAMRPGGFSLIFGPLISTIAGFFIGVGLIFLFAKMFGGQGTFLQQGYATLLWEAPLTILGSIIAIIPFLGPLVALALFIYGIVLNVFTVMAVHRLSGGRAAAAVLLPIAVLMVLACAIVLAAGALIWSMFQQAPPSP